MSAAFWKPAEKVSEHFRWGEFAVSGQHPELVEPVPDEYRESVEQLARTCLDPIRRHTGRANTILSGFRSPALNLAVGGSPTSQHTKAQAADTDCASDPKQVFEDLVNRVLVIPAGQVIWYPFGSAKAPATSLRFDRDFLHVALPSNRFPELSLHIHAPSKGFTYQRVSSLGALRSFLSRLTR